LIYLPKKRGFIPKTGYYNRYYGENRWKAHTIISNSIGQGEILTTPLQLANLAAIIANKGYYITPHTVKDIEGIDTLDKKYMQKHWVTVDTSFFSLCYRWNGESSKRTGRNSTTGVDRTRW
jgi:penicillin-binding protein 2